MLIVERHSLTSALISRLWLTSCWLASGCCLQLQPFDLVNSPLKRPRTLLSLPNELLIELAIHLDPTDIYSLRLCCERLREVTETQQLWRRMARTLYEDHLLNPPIEGIHTYTTKELERWTMRRHYAQGLWKANKQPRPRTRVVDLGRRDGDLGRTSHYLLPGGRWLLVARSSSVMCAFDLDSAIPQPHIVYDGAQSDVGDNSHREQTIYSFWDDRSNSRVLRVAATVENLAAPKSFVFDLHLTRLTEAHPSVTSYKAFRKPVSDLTPWKTAINEHYYVEACVDPHWWTTKQISVYPYTRVHERCRLSLLEPVVQISFEHEPVVFLDFVHNDVFVVYTTDGGLCLYDIVEHDLGSCKSHSMNLLHAIPLSVHTPSSIRHCSGASYLVTATFSGDLQGIRIPYDCKKPPSIKHLGECNSFIKRRELGKLGQALGISISLSLHDSDNPIGIVNHKFGPEECSDSIYFKTSSPFQFKIPVMTRFSKLINFDEDVGRMIMYKDFEAKELLVVDLAPSYL